VRGRAGYAAGRTLVYATGGFAYGSVDNQAEAGLYVTDAGKIVTGYTLGGGAEY
jgi:outer membrane immunogenic protein